MYVHWEQGKLLERTRSSMREKQQLYGFTYEKVSMGLGPHWVTEPFHSQVLKVHSPNPSQEKRMSDVVRIGSIIICQLSKL